MSVQRGIILGCIVDGHCCVWLQCYNISLSEPLTPAEASTLSW